MVAPDIHPRRCSRRAVTGGLAFILAGCGGGNAPQPSYYRLASSTDTASRAGGPLPGVVDVLPFRAAGMLNDRAILYRNGSVAIAGYNYHSWWAAPTTMLQDSLVDTLRRAKAFDLITTPEMRLDRIYEIAGEIRHLEQDGTSVTVELELMLRLARSGAPLLLKTYRQEASAGDGAVPAVVAAFSTAVAQIWTQFVADLGDVKPPPPANPV